VTPANQRDSSADRVASGRAVYARNLGLSEADAEALMTERAGAEFTQEAFNAAGGPGWHTGALTDRDRSIAVIAALVSQHVTDDRLGTYLAVARRNGITEQGLTALMILLAAYLGQPATSVAMTAVRRSAPVELRRES
jgi:4-carboxymuconolactone decarboxylase